MAAPIPRPVVRRQDRARRPDRVPMFVLLAALGLGGVLEVPWTVAAQAGPPITVTNALPSSTVCANGNTVTIFTSAQQVLQPGGPSITVNGDFSAFPGIGIQVNNWYWTDISVPVQSGNPQNPDNSGAQFAISDQCALSQAPAWFGKGIPTYVIATVTAQKTNGGCTITIAQNTYTDAVTPGCCSPPGIGSNTCSGPWGITNNHAGEPWPPQ